MSATYDVIVAGSGHNGLIVGAYLAKAGKNVLILEKNPWFGGGTATREIAAPGYRHDLHSSGHAGIQSNPLLKNDELGLLSKYGLKYIYPDSSFSTVFEDGSSLVCHHDLDRTCESIAQISAPDAEAYRKVSKASMELLPLMAQSMFVPPASLGGFTAMMDQSPQGQDLLQTMLRSPLDIVNQYFRSDKLKVHLLRFVAETFIHPEEKGCGMGVFGLLGLMHKGKAGIAQGGSGALAEALVRCLKAYGADLRTNSEVTKVLVEAGKAVGVQLKDGESLRAKSCVVGQFHPWVLPNLVDGLDERLVRNAKRTTVASVTCTVGHYALKAAPAYILGGTAGDAPLVSFASSSLAEFRRVFHAIADNEIPASPMISVHNNARFDPSRAPAGGATLTSWRLVPFELRGTTWDAIKDKVEQDTLGILRRYISNLTPDNIVGQAFETPLDMYRYSPTFQRGDVTGISKNFYQLNGHRPTPELSQYAVPGVQGLYLAGIFMHPGGAGVSGGGRATAIKIFEDLKMDFDKVTQ